MSVDPKIAVLSAQNELLAEDRIYTDFQEMAAKESERADGIDAVVIATPPQLHYAAAKAFLERGIDVICEKPMTKSVDTPDGPRWGGGYAAHRGRAPFQ
jgi:predicted dehydrogenase